MRTSGKINNTPAWPNLRRTGPGRDKHIKRGAKASSLSLPHPLGHSSPLVFGLTCLHASKMDFPQFSSVAQSCPTFCNTMNPSTPGLPVHHQLPEFTQIHVHRVSDAIQPSHPLSSPSPPAPKSLPASESFSMSQLFA